jgi:hypothetical protein
MKTMILALAAATVLSLGVAHAADHPRKAPRDADPKNRVILVHSEPTNADQRNTDPKDCYRFV